MRIAITLFFSLSCLQALSFERESPACSSGVQSLCHECDDLASAAERIQVHEECEYWSRLGDDFVSYVGKQTMSCLCGIGNSGWDMAVGIYEMGRHPIQTYRAMKELVAHPIRHAQAVFQELRQNVAGFGNMGQERQAAYMCSSLIHVVLAGNNIRRGVQRGLERARRSSNASQNVPVRVDIGSSKRAPLSQNLPKAASSVYQKNGRYYIEQTVGGRARKVMIDEEVALQIQNKGTITVYRATHYPQELAEFQSGKPLSTWAQRRGGKSVEEVHSEIRDLHGSEARLSQRIREHGGHTNESPFISTTANKLEARNNFGRHPDAKIMKFEIPVDEILVGNQSEWEILFQGPIPAQYFQGVIK
ncbi:MAG: hypothetical protein WD025_00225 [Bacteriovoracaceae bacterium]